MAGGVPFLVIDPGTEHHGTILRVEDGTRSVGNLHPNHLPIGTHRYRVMVRKGVMDAETQAVLMLIYMDPLDVLTVEKS